ncbi:hypothetical protein D3C71_1991590 [compost metagenome]
MLSATTSRTMAAAWAANAWRCAGGTCWLASAMAAASDAASASCWLMSCAVLSTRGAGGAANDGRAAGPAGSGR